MSYVYQIEMIESGQTAKFWGQIIASDANKAIDLVTPPKFAPYRQWIARKLRQAKPNEVSKF